MRRKVTSTDNFSRPHVCLYARYIQGVQEIFFQEFSKVYLFIASTRLLLVEQPANRSDCTLNTLQPSAKGSSDYLFYLYTSYLHLYTSYLHLCTSYLHLELATFTFVLATVTLYQLPKPLYQLPSPLYQLPSPLYQLPSPLYQLPSPCTSYLHLVLAT